MEKRKVFIAAFFWLMAHVSLSLAGEKADGARAGLVVYSDGQAKITAYLGERKTILHDGQYGLRYFPDGAIAVVRQSPEYRILLAAGVSSYLLQGKSMESLALLRKVLAPGSKGSFDNGYAGISAAYLDKKSGELLAFYHAEDQEDMGRCASGVPGFYCSVALALSPDEGFTFTKSGPVITSQLPKDPKGPPDQGCGEVCVTPDKDNRYLFAYYTEHSRVDRRGVQICLARCRIEDRGRPGTWRKFYEGSFSQPGLGGKDTPVVSAQDTRADALCPHVTYSKILRKYVMVLNINAYAEFLKGTRPEQSGIYVGFSDDGIAWSKPAKLITIYSIPLLGKEIGLHPTLIWSDSDGGAPRVSGSLYYAYSESWGHRPPQKPHCLVGQPIRFALETEP
jgi:hypothetical protein